MAGMKDKNKNKTISLLLCGGYGDKSYSRFLHIGISNTVIYFERKLILTTQGKTEAGLNMTFWVNFPERQLNLQSPHATRVSHNLYHRTECSEIIKNILAKAKEREVLMFLQSCVRPCQQLQQSHPKSTEFQKSLTYLLH